MLIPALYKDMPRTKCLNVLEQDDLQFPLTQQLIDIDRLCFHALIPDLQIVALGSQAGRVALLTPTKMDERMSALGDVLTMRLEKTLPLRMDEVEHRPRVWMLGMSVSPVWRKQKGMGELRDRAEAWRIFLHYRDHTIISYELFRDEDDDLNVV